MTKQEARAFFLKERTKIDLFACERIAEQLLEVLSEKLTLVHSFIGAATRNEVDTKRIRQILQVERPAIQWAAPRMIPGTKAMEHYAWNDETELSTNRWGIEEPDSGTSQRIDIQLVDIVLIPLLAFDKQGQRVGYGGGYYDCFLPQCRTDTVKVGLSFFEPIEAIEDVNAYDVKLDSCVTPGKVYRWSK